MWFLSKNKCTNRHILFANIGHSFKAIDTWCGHEAEGQVWYCSEECMNIGKEGAPLEYKPVDEPISND